VTARGSAAVVYVTSHSGQISLLPSAGREMSTGQGAVAVLCGREGNRGLTSCVRLGDISTYGLSDLTKEDKCRYPSPFYLDGIRYTSRHAALLRDCLYPPAHPSALVSHAAGMTSLFWHARHNPSPLFRPAAGLRSSPAARLST